MCVHVSVCYGSAILSLICLWVCVAFTSGGGKAGLDPSILSSMAEVSEEHSIPTADNTAYGTLEQ